MNPKLSEYMRGFRDRDFIQTKEGFFFCVVGGIHLPNRIISYLKYIPSQNGNRKNKNKKYTRILKKYTVPNLIETLRFLEQNHPYYLFNSPIYNTKITAVPINKIKFHFKPEKKLSYLRNKADLDPLQRKLIKFLEILEKISGISKDSFGVTGSLLLNIHNPIFSDIDVIVYGIKNSWILKKVLTQCKEFSPLNGLKGTSLKNWILRKIVNYPLDKNDAMKIYNRKWNIGYFNNTWISIHPVKLEQEITHKFNQRQYHPKGQATI